MTDFKELKAEVERLAEKRWNRQDIEARYRRLMAEGIPRKKPSREDILAERQQILERVQRRGEEYEYLSHS